MNIENTSPTYTSANIKVLKGLDAVRKRPGMYIGNTEDGSGLHHLIYEILDNCIDEAIAGYCNLIHIILHEDGAVSVSDNGRGMPIDMHAEENRPAAEVIMTVLHAGGKFDQSSYAISGGLHGVGVSVVNALSSFLELTIKRDGLIYKQAFADGIPKPYVMTNIGPHDTNGTLIKFYPSKLIFSNTEFEPMLLEKRLSEMSFLNKNIKIELYLEKEKKTLRFYSEKGLIDFINNITHHNVPISDPLFLTSVEDDTQLNIALMWSKDLYREDIRCFTNNIPQIDGGTHLIGFKAGITRAINSYIDKEILHKKYKTIPSIIGDDIRSGLTAIISLYTPTPSFSSQTKDKLVTASIRPLVETATSNTVFEFFMENRKIAEQIVDKIISSSMSREAARKARDLNRQTVEQSGIVHSLSGKLSFCQEKNPADIELFLVEGDSAGGSAKQARQRKFQAILPLKGKILNVEKSGVEQMLKSNEILNIITSLGTGIGERFNELDVKYHKIIIMTDADIDGRHIETLLLTFFYRYMRPLIERGYIYIAQPPLYSIKSGSTDVYLKDEVKLEQYFSYLASKDTIITSGNLLIKENELYLLLQKYREYLSYKEKFAYNYSHHIIDSLLTHNMYDTKHVQWWLDLLNILNHNDLNLTYSIANDISIICQDTLGGNETEYSLENILSSDLYITLYRNCQDIALVNCDTINVCYKNKDYPFSDIYVALSWLLEQVRASKSIKRYKGLGEMNPEQLWDSTMNPANRRLLQVTIYDAEAADMLLNILMGTEVHLRRDFIIKHSQFITFKV